MIRRILLAFDGSNHSWVAWQYAADIAIAYDATVHAVAIVDSRLARLPGLITVARHEDPCLEEDHYKSFTLAVEECRREMLSQVEQQAKQKGVRFSQQIAHGIPAEVICLEETNADLIVMGHRGETPPWPESMLGSNAQSVIRHSVKPVFVARHTYQPIHRILVCYDGSAHSLHGLFLAAHLAETMQLPMLVLSAHLNIRLAEETVAEAQVHLKSSPLDVVTRAVSATAAEGILDVATKEDCDLIVMGVRGQSIFSEALIGKTTLRVMQQSALPLLLTK